MHDKRIPAGAPVLDDLRDQAAVLDHVLALHPASLTLDELTRELSVGEVDFAQRDRIQRAVRDLACVGLVRTTCDLILPTRAAVTFHAIRAEH
jgi:hypothetical protein